MRAEQLHQKLGLVQQLKTLARQHEQILQAYERKVQEKLQEGSLAVAAGGKRAGPPLVAEGPEAKRHRQLAERASRKNELWNEVVKIVEKIRKNTKSEPFRQPVDPIKLKIPDYLNVISKPMDLGTVLKKLRSKPLGYTQPQEVAEDVRQIWTNCRTYNGLNHPVSQAANTCSEAFEKSWGQANIEQRWEVEMMREQREEQAFAGGEAEAADDNIVNQLRYKRNMLGDLIAAKDVQDNLPPGSLGDLVPERDMTFEEKRKLSAHMASLPGEKLVHVLDIISEAENLQADGDGEVEVDIDALHNNTLWKLKAYVDGVLTATSGPPPKKSANRSAPNKQGPPAAAAAAGGMPPPPPPVAASQPGLPLPQQQSAPQQQQQQPLATGAMPPPPQQPPQFQQPQPVQPPVQQQQQQQSPVHSGGQSAQEVVGSTAGGPGAARSHQFTYDMGTVAQSGTNARPSNFVMGKARQSTPTADAAGAAAAAGDQPAQTGPTHMDAGTAEQWEAALKGGEGEAPAAAAAAGATDAAAGAAPAAAGEAAAAATPSAPAADEPAAAGDAATAEPAAAADAVVAAPAEAPAAPEAAAAPSAAADEVPAAPAAADEAPAPPAAAAAAGDGSGDVDLWDKFASAAAQEENKLKQEQEKAQREKQEAEEQQRLKAEQEQQKQQQEKDARAAEIFGGMGGAGATGASDDAVHADVEKLLNCAPAAAPAAAGGASSTPPLAAAAAAAAAGEGDGPDAMDVDTEEEKQQEEAEDDDGEPADGGGFD